MGCTTSRLSSAGESNGGEIVRKFESELDHESKGTTIIALFYKWGVIVGVDSRSSNEWQSEKPLTIKDGNHDKMFQISSRIFAMMTGTVADCFYLRDYVKQRCSHHFQKEGESVPYVVQMAYDHLNGLPDKENKVVGALIAGWDADNGVQVYRVYIRDSRIHSEQVYSARTLFTSLGSGSKHAIKIMKSLYKSLMDEDEAVDVVLKALHNATFFDKFTGGPLKVYRVRNKYEKICSVNALVVKNPVVCSPLDSQPYTLHEYESRVLFLVYSTFFAPIYASQLMDYFRNQDAEVVAAHVVVKKRDFYFHRVVCKSEEDALRIYRYVQNSPPQPFKDTWSPLQRFPLPPVVLRNGVLVYVNKSSKNLLQLIVNASDE